jgi:N-acetylneuraminic acid mutarotase
VKKGSTPVVGTISYDASTKTATFTPSTTLSYGTTYNITLSAGIVDAAGNPLTEIIQYFTTRAKPKANTWTPKADFVVKRTRAAAFSIGDKGYIGTGYDDSGYKNDFWEYDIVANAWTQKADFGGTARESAVGFSIGSKGYVGTGRYGSYDSASYYKDFWEYDPVANTWAQKVDFGGGARAFAVGFSIGSKGYIGTGYDISNLKFTKDFWEYDPAVNTWTQRIDFAGTERIEGIGFSIGNKGYIGTGYDGGAFRNDFWEFDPIKNAWFQKADFGGVARRSAVGFSIGNITGVHITMTSGSSIRPRILGSRRPILQGQPDALPSALPPEAWAT